MTLNAHLLGELACVLPKGEPYTAPQAPAPLDVLEEPRRRPGPAPSEKPPKAKKLRPRVAANRVLLVLKDNPAITARDIQRLLARRGWKRGVEAVAHVLKRLRRLGLVERTVLKTARDIERAGGRYLWTAVEVRT